MTTLGLALAAVNFFDNPALADSRIGRLPGNTGLRTGALLNFIGSVIKVALGLVGAILLVLIVYGGFTYATAAGSDEKVKKGRNILTYAIVGIVIIAAAWVITDFVIGNILLDK